MYTMKHQTPWTTILSCCILTLLLSTPLHAKQVEVNVGLSNPVILAGEKVTNYVKIALTGLPMPEQTERTPVNLAIVLDRSGSMQGEKIQQAKAAARKAVEMLAPQDIISIVTYESNVRVLVPATRVTDKQQILNAINNIQPAGSTALFGGVSKGAYEVRKFLSDNRVNRIILLSDGLANQGPSTPGELGALGHSLGSEGITVSTIGLGLGYNEDLMTELAMKSDGNHIFAENAEDVHHAFAAEMGDALSVVAQELSIAFTCRPGIRPVRVLGREAEIAGQRVHLSLNQLYNEQEKYVILEVEVPEYESGQDVLVGEAAITYTDMCTKETEKEKVQVTALTTTTQEAVDQHLDKDIMVAVIYMQGLETNKRALALRDEGKVEEAKALAFSNGSILIEWGEKLESEKLNEYGISNNNDAINFDLSGEAYNRNRKMMKATQNSIQTQQKTLPKISAGTRIIELPKEVQKEK